MGRFADLDAKLEELPTGQYALVLFLAAAGVWVVLDVGLGLLGLHDSPPMSVFPQAILFGVVFTLVFVLLRKRER